MRSFLTVVRAGILSGVCITVVSLALCDLAPAIASATTSWFQQYVLVAGCLLVAGMVGVLLEHRLSRQKRIISPTNRRRGFTLVEILIVVAIIGVLIALLVPAAVAVLNRSRVAAVKSEIAAIDSAIADFKSEFNDVPPSYISFIPENRNGRIVLPAATSATLRSMFPQIQLNVDPSQGDTPIRDSLVVSELWSKELYGIECLVLCLGGMRGFDDTNANGQFDTGEPLTNELTGFSKNPSNPFAIQSADGTGRTGPFFEFDSSRLTDIDSDNLLEYKDSLSGQSQPMVYVSTAGTGNYTPSHSGISGWTPYTKDNGEVFKPNSYQIVSPGYDASVGAGGSVSELSAPDADNISNFSDGQLAG